MLTGGDNVRAIVKICHALRVTVEASHVYRSRERERPPTSWNITLDVHNMYVYGNWTYVDRVGI